MARRRIPLRVWGPALCAAGALAVLAVFVSVTATIVAVCLMLWFTLWRLIRNFQRERAAVQGRMDEMRGHYEFIISTLSGALGLTDSVTAKQAQRISQLAAVVAWQMGLRKDHLRRIEQAAILHDIGKMGIGDNILSKTGPLDDGEWEAMKRHPKLGYQVLNGIDFLQEVAQVIYAHHERWDGGGYPRGLCQDEIPLGSRLFAVVDAYHAMTSNRPYRRAMPHREAVEEIVRNSGSQFDPQVVQAFLDAERRGLIAGDGASGEIAETVAITEGVTE
jgi:putative nucleotidyltransferase with HDIG domain